MSLIEELKRRKVVRAAIVYGAVGFAVLQAAELLTGVFQLPQVVLTVIGIVLVLGLPVVLVMAWAFDLTPAGLTRSHASDAVADPQGAEGWLPLRLGAAAVGLVALGLVLGWVVRYEKPPGSDGRVLARSVAVMPFLDLSQGGDQEYLSDGISEEILNQLVKIGDLQVSARTSSFAYKGQDRDLRQVGAELGVATVLEGSVRKEGDNLRITAQLIETSTGFHLWSETYDRRLEGVLALQDEIAREVATALSARLTPDEEGRLDRGPLDNTAAYELLQRARAQDPTDATEIRASIELLRQAIALDGAFSDAHEALASAYVNWVEVHGMPLSWADSAVTAADRAIELDPDHARAHGSRGFARYLQGRLAQAVVDLDRGVELAPGDAEILTQRAVVLAWGQGDRVRGLADALKGARLDPQNPFRSNAVGAILSFLDYFEESERWLTKSLELQPGFTWAAWNLADVYRLQGRLEDARAVVRSMREAAPGSLNPLLVSLEVESSARNWRQVAEDFEQVTLLRPQQTYGLDYRLVGGEAFLALGESARAHELLASVMEDGRRLMASTDQGGYVQTAGALAMTGRPEEALRVLEQWMDAGARPLPRHFDLAFFEGLRSDPRLRALVDRATADLRSQRQQVEERGMNRVEPGPTVAP